jgi:hypothetical protein
MPECAVMLNAAAPRLFLLELVRLGLSREPEFPDLGGTFD